MRKRLSIILAVVGLMVLMTSSVVKAMGIGVGGTLGYVSMNMGDLKDWYASKVTSFDDSGYTFTGRSFQSNILYGVDGRFAFGENFMFRMGYSRLSGSQTIEITSPVSEKDGCQVSAHAITGSLILAMPLDSFKVYGGGGLGYYLADCTITDGFGTQQYIEKGSGSTIGFHGFVGTEIMMGKNFSISLEALYRVAKLASINCTESTQTGGFWEGPSTVRQPLRRHTNYPIVWPMDDTNYKDLELDFGGFNILAALHIYF